MKPLLRFFLTALFLLPALCAVAQERKLQYRPYADLRPFHYGFFCGVHMESLRLVNNGYIDPDTGSQWLVSNDRYDPGFTVGILGEWRLTENLALRLLPTMNFGTKHLTFVDQATGLREHQDVKSTYVALPVNVKFTPPRINNYRPYLMAGLNPMYDLTIKDQENIMLKPFNLFLEFGFGCDRYLPFFKFIPELKFSLGLNDILQTDRKELRDRSKEVFTRSVGKGTTKMITLTFYFE
ncbi:MAG: PorT family protein [Bacteroidaceae bacterium]|nr:PorT family protein [Bacteroidaceae bacterium]